MEATAALCATHPDLPSDGTCQRCGLFLCERCRKWHVGRMLCFRCYALAIQERPSRQATLALVFATLGFCGFAPGIVALVLAYRELAAIRRGEAPGSGEGHAVLARNLGWFHAAMLAISAVALVARLG